MFTAPPPRLADLPLWRLLVALHDAEEIAGPGSESALAIKAAIEERLGRPRPPRLRLEDEEGPDVA
jgi:hypothetical protein